MKIQVHKLPHAIDLPFYATAGSSGADVCAALSSPYTLKVGERALIPTGLCLDIPDGWEIQIRPRSGLALKHGIAVLNSPGTIDSDYQGEVQIILINTGINPFIIEPGMRIAQFVLCPVMQAIFEEGSAQKISERGQQGFGSTGL